MLPKLVNRQKIVLFLALLASVIIGTVFFLEKAYTQCRGELSQKFINWVGSVSCTNLEESLLKSDLVKNKYADYANVHLVEREKIGGANGIACQKSAFIANDLPQAAKAYVAHHEYLHTQGVGSESLANIGAAIKEPVGFFQTVAHSLKISLTKETLDKCRLASLWKNFKVYFLNDTFEDLMNYP